MATRPVHDEPSGTRESIEALRRELERLRAVAGEDRGLLDAILRHSPHGIIVCDVHGKLVLQNRASERIWAGSATADDVAGWGAYRAFHPDGRPYAPSDWSMARCLASGDVVDAEEVRFQRFDGSLGWMLGSCAPLRDENGAIGGAVSIFADISALKSADASVRESEQRLHAILDGVRDHAITMLDADGHVLTWNAGAVPITGWTLEEVRGRHVRFFFAEADRDAGVPERELEVARTKGSFAGEGFRVRRDGSRFAATTSISALRDERGGVVGFVKVTHDITRFRELHAREEQTRREAEAATARLQTLARTARIIAEADADERAVIDALVRAMSGAVDGVCGVFLPSGDALELAAVADAEPSRGALIRVAFEGRRIARGESATGRAFSTLRTVRLEARDASDAPLRPEGAPLLGPAIAVPLSAKGTCLGVLSVARARGEPPFAEEDVQLVEEIAHRAALALDNARLHRERQQALARAEEASRMKDEFLAIVSHELRTPLAAIVGWTSLLRRPRGCEPPSLARGLEVIDRNARAQGKIIEDILDVSRIVRGKLALDPRPTSLAKIAREALETVRTSAAAKEIEIHFDAGDDPFVVVADEARLRQIVWNLLSNAIKFTPARGRVWVGLSRAPGEISLSVVDDGVGLDEEFLPHVFERFRQAERSSTRRHGGLGLGLAIVRHLVEAHGGHVRVESEGLGRGATFTATFPVREAQATTGAPSDERAPPSRSRVEREAVDLRGVRVLVVDDEPDARELAERVLRGHGAEVVLCESAGAALATLDRWTPDVIVADLAMPIVDGFALLREVRGRPAPIGALPALALTAFARAEDEARAEAAGFTMHLAKPTDPDELARAVARLAPAERSA